MPGAVSVVEAARERYRPKDVRVLFVGESAPAGGTFFYFANSKLYFATRDAFRLALGKRGGRDFLVHFQTLGCFLEDLCPSPVNRLPDPQRREQRRRGEPELARRLRAASPRVVVVVMSGIRENVNRALREADLAALPTHVLPFPGREEHRRRYVAELAAIVRELVAQEVLVAPSPAAESRRRFRLRRGR